MNFLRTNVVDSRTAATEVLTRDLPALPLSHLVLALEAYNATDEATLAEMLGFINNIKVTDQGVTIFDAQSEDIHALNTYLFKMRPNLTGKLATDNYTRQIGLIIPFGRRIFDPAECYPKRDKGEVQVAIDYTAPSSSADNGEISLDAVCLPEATPHQYLKTSFKTVVAPGATGDNDISLPIGHPITLIQVRMTTFPTTSSHTYGVEQATVYLDEQEHGYAGNNAQTLVADRMLVAGDPGINIAAQGLNEPADVVWLDYDPMRNGEFALQTEGAASAFLRLNMGVDEATYLTINELVPA